MKNQIRIPLFLAACVCVLAVSAASAQDWPQWRGPNRDGKASFKAPATWPKELNQKWQSKVGLGDATPALVGDKLYVFARQEGREVVSCLEAATGKELWHDGYDTLGAAGPSAPHAGPRSSPTFANGKVITYGVRGILCCWNAADGKLLWRKDDLPGIWPRFFTASSPLVTGDLCIAQLGGENNGAVVAYALATGEQKWKWTGDGTAYSSPVLMNLGGSDQLVAMTAKMIVGLDLKDGKQLWSIPFAPQGRAYNAATPILDGAKVIYAGAGRGTRAAQIDKQGSEYAVKELWTNNDGSVQFNTPVLHDGRIYGLTPAGDLFCVGEAKGDTLWTEKAPVGRSNGFGSVVDTGSVLVALGPAGELVVFQPSDKEFQKVASYKVAQTEVYATPVLSGNRIYVKDKDSLTLWTVD